MKGAIAGLVPQPGSRSASPKSKALNSSRARTNSNMQTCATDLGAQNRSTPLVADPVQRRQLRRAIEAIATPSRSAIWRGLRATGQIGKYATGR